MPRGTSADDPQQCVFAHRYHETIGKTGCRPASQREAKMVHDGLQPLRAPAVPDEDVVIEPLAKNAATAEDTITLVVDAHDWLEHIDFEVVPVTATSTDAELRALVAPLTQRTLYRQDVVIEGVFGALYSRREDLLDAQGAEFFPRRTRMRTRGQSSGAHFIGSRLRDTVPSKFGARHNLETKAIGRFLRNFLTQRCRFEGPATAHDLDGLAITRGARRFPRHCLEDLIRRSADFRSRHLVARLGTIDMAMRNTLTYAAALKWAPSAQSNEPSASLWYSV